MTRDQNHAGEDTMRCRECGTEILAVARVCGHCESYQSHWRNELRYFANIAGVFTVIGTAIFFSISLAPSLRVALSWRDHVEVVGLDGPHVAIANAGDGDVFLYEVVFEAPNGRTFSHSIRDTLSKGAVLKLNEQEYHFMEDDDGFLETSRTYARALSESDDLWERGTGEAGWEEWGLHPDGSDDMRCFMLVPLMEQGLFWNRYERLIGDRPSTVPISATLRGFSLGKGEVFERSQTVDALLMYIHEAPADDDVHPVTGEPVEPDLIRCEVF